VLRQSFLRVDDVGELVVQRIHDTSVGEVQQVGYHSVWEPLRNPPLS
jgi:hypothetical protein